MRKFLLPLALVLASCGGNSQQAKPIDSSSYRASLPAQRYDIKDGERYVSDGKVSVPLRISGPADIQRGQRYVFTVDAQTNKNVVFGGEDDSFDIDESNIKPFRMYGDRKDDGSGTHSSLDILDVAEKAKEQFEDPLKDFFGDFLPDPQDFLKSDVVPEWIKSGETEKVIVYEGASPDAGGIVKLSPHAFYEIPVTVNGSGTLRVYEFDQRLLSDRTPVREASFQISFEKPQTQRTEPPLQSGPTEKIVDTERLYRTAFARHEGYERDMLKLFGNDMYQTPFGNAVPVFFILTQRLSQGNPYDEVFYIGRREVEGMSFEGFRYEVSAFLAVEPFLDESELSEFGDEIKSWDPIEIDLWYPVLEINLGGFRERFLVCPYQNDFASSDDLMPFIIPSKGSEDVLEVFASQNRQTTTRTDFSTRGRALISTVFERLGLYKGVFPPYSDSLSFQRHEMNNTEIFTVRDSDIPCISVALPQNWEPGQRPFVADLSRKGVFVSATGQTVPRSSVAEELIDDFSHFVPVAATVRRLMDTLDLNEMQKAHLENGIYDPGYWKTFEGLGFISGYKSPFESAVPRDR